MYGVMVMVELTIEAVLENLEKVNSFVTTAIEPVKCSPRVTMQLLMAVEEIFVNIAHYAYTPGKGPATISCEVKLDTPLQVIIKFIDGGMPYNPLQNQDPDTSLPVEERDIGGLGILLVKKSMDSVLYEYDNGKNILTIIKTV